MSGWNYRCIVKTLNIFSTSGNFGDVHFDDEENFTVGKKGRGIDLFWLALHELGHSLGLDHSSNKGAIMYPIYRGNHRGLQLHRDDIVGIQQLYGESEFIVIGYPVKHEYVDHTLKKTS